MAGVLDDKMLAYTNAAGEKLSEAIDRVGGDVAHLDRAQRSDIAGYLELHIDQGVVLQNSGTDLGPTDRVQPAVNVRVQGEPGKARPLRARRGTAPGHATHPR